MEESERIPEDIRSAAEDVAFDCGPPSTHAEVARHIARALLAERERCARVAENFDAWPQEGADIAAAIRA